MGKKRRVKKGLILFLLLLVLFGVVFLVYKKINYKKTPTPDKPEVIDSIDNFQYELNDNETEYYVELFNALKDLLKNEDYDEEQYALLVSKLFTADFYDLDSKIMKSDVGGTQFVYSDYRSDFENGAMDSMYKFIESNVYGDRKQELPVVKSINDISIEQKSFEYGDNIDFDAYYITLGINYEKNLDYPEEVLLVLIHNDDKLEVAKLETLKKD